MNLPLKEEAAIWLEKYSLAKRPPILEGSQNSYCQKLRVPQTPLSETKDLWNYRVLNLGFL